MKVADCEICGQPIEDGEEVIVRYVGKVYDNTWTTDEPAGFEHFDCPKTEEEVKEEEIRKRTASLVGAEFENYAKISEKKQVLEHIFIVPIEEYSIPELYKWVKELADNADKHYEIVLTPSEIKVTWS